MKSLLSTLVLLLSFSALAEPQLLLLPADGEGEGLVVKAMEESSLKAEEGHEDLDLLDNEYDEAPSFADRHLTIEGQVSATIMALSARGSVGVRALNDYIEIGVDSGLMFIGAGESGAVVPEVGLYAKVRLNPEAAKTVYFKGRAYKAWGLNDDLDLLKEYSVGMESENGGFIELSVRHFHFNDGDQFFLPFINMGTRFGGPKAAKKANGEPLLFGN